MAEELVSYSSDNWRFTGEPLNGVFGLHGSVMLLLPTFVLAGMFWQFTNVSPLTPFLLFWGAYICLAGYAKLTGYSPREAIQRLVVRFMFRGRYKVR